MSSWKIKELKAEKLKNPVLIAGLPGIGNVGKIAVDFLIEELDAKKLYELSSFNMPHSVFINEKNLIELPRIEVYCYKGKSNDLLFLAGDVQPPDEKSCYEFSEEVINLLRKNNCKDIITLGGIGLMDIPKKPQLYCTGNTKKAVDKYKNEQISNNLYGIVGPIVGVSGLLLGLADKNMDAVAILAETYGHPMYLGVKGAKEILKTISTKFSFKINIDKLDDEIKEIEEDILKKTEELTKVQAAKQQKVPDVNYIG